ncbi:MAG: hypothetical protein HYT89_03810 [Candidatus Omnitrophica bacterium]|nr:hypothetical protein [Candidatus Omnitrophota bacterium]
MTAKDADLVIIDYGVGNLFNVQRAFTLVGARTMISKGREDGLSAKKLLLPGVGAFSEGMRRLGEYGLIDAVRERAKSGCPILGICLGMQLFMTHLVAGEVKRFREPETGLAYKIPQIGRNA